jgi:pimeloyl-ACP methyl ester carboxylesterase
MKYVKIHYGWTKSGDWPRMAMVRALQQQAIYADPVVNDWPRIKARTLVIGGEKDGADYPGGARRVAESVQRGNPPLLRFLKGEDVGTFWNEIARLATRCPW